jgi:hypothetical protein
MQFISVGEGEDEAKNYSTKYIAPPRALPAALTEFPLKVQLTSIGDEA